MSIIAKELNLNDTNTKYSNEKELDLNILTKYNKNNKTNNKNDINKIIIDNSNNIKPFEEVGISTQTVIAISNIQIDLDKFFKYIPITEYIQQEKKRGRKKRNYISVDNTKKLPEGSVILIQRKKEHRGCLLKSKKNSTFFLHSVTVVLVLENNKFINVKVSSNGKFQITGCKYQSHFVNTMYLLFKKMEEIQEMTGECCYKFIHSDNTFRVVYNVVMQNIDFNIGFNIRRDKLDRFINKYTEFVSIYQSSIHPTLIVKVSSEKINEDQLIEFYYDRIEKTKGTRNVPYSTYLNQLDEKERKKESNTDKHHTFLIFATGSIIMSSRGPDMKRVFYKLISCLVENRSEFEDLTSEQEKIQIQVTPLE
jgi:hypothetical protein